MEVIDAERLKADLLIWKAEYEDAIKRPDPNKDAVFVSKILLGQINDIFVLIDQIREEHKYINADLLRKRIEGLKADAIARKDHCKRGGLTWIMVTIGTLKKVLSIIDALQNKEDKQ